MKSLIALLLTLAPAAHAQMLVFNAQDMTPGASYAELHVKNLMRLCENGGYSAYGVIVAQEKQLGSTCLADLSQEETNALMKAFSEKCLLKMNKIVLENKVKEVDGGLYRQMLGDAYAPFRQQCLDAQIRDSHMPQTPSDTGGESTR